MTGETSPCHKKRESWWLVRILFFMVGFFMLLVDIYKTTKIGICQQLYKLWIFFKYFLLIARLSKASTSPESRSTAAYLTPAV